MRTGSEGLSRAFDWKMTLRSVGGIYKNVGMVKRLEQKLGVKALIAFEPQIVGSVGPALFAKELVHKKGGEPG